MTSNLYFHRQDLPEYFEDNMQTWMTHFLTLLNTDNKLLQTDVSECLLNLALNYDILPIKTLN